MSVAVAARSGDERELLCSLRDAIADALDEGVPARDLASLSKRLMEIRREIADIDVRREEEGGGVVDTPDEEWDEDF